MDKSWQINTSVTWSKAQLPVRRKSMKCPSAASSADLPMPFTPFKEIKRLNPEIQSFCLIFFESFETCSTGIGVSNCKRDILGSISWCDWIRLDYGKDLFDMCPDFNTQHCIIKTADGLDFSKHIVFQRSTCQGGTLQGVVGSLCVSPKVCKLAKTLTQSIELFSNP